MMECYAMIMIGWRVNPRSIEDGYHASDLDALLFPIMGMCDPNLDAMYHMAFSLEDSKKARPVTSSPVSLKQSSFGQRVLPLTHHLCTTTISQLSA